MPEARPLCVIVIVTAHNAHTYDVIEIAAGNYVVANVHLVRKFPHEFLAPCNSSHAISFLEGSCQTAPHIHDFIQIAHFVVAGKSTRHEPLLRILLELICFLAWPVHPYTFSGKLRLVIVACWL